MNENQSLSMHLNIRCSSAESQFLQADVILTNHTLVPERVVTLIAPDVVKGDCCDGRATTRNEQHTSKAPTPSGQTKEE